MQADIPASAARLAGAIVVGSGAVSLGCRLLSSTAAIPFDVDREPFSQATFQEIDGFS